MIKKKVAVVGAKGKMGSEICKILKDEFEVIKIDIKDDINNFEVDLVVDFASAESSVESAKYCKNKKVPLIVGATGHTEDELFEIEKLKNDIPVMICSNFSIGIMILKHLIDVIMKFEIEDICIFEKHHKQKKDKPSGTAKELFNMISKYTKKEIQIFAERGGDEIGTHNIDFYFGGELISVKHQAFSRKIFAIGVLHSVRFMLNKTQNRMYFFEEVVKEKFGLNC